MTKTDSPFELYPIPIKTSNDKYDESEPADRHPVCLDFCGVEISVFVCQANSLIVFPFSEPSFKKM